MNVLHRCFLRPSRLLAGLTAAAIAPAPFAATHIAANFNSGSPWSLGTYGHITPSVGWNSNTGTVDTYNGGRTGALYLISNSSAAPGYWSSALQTGRFALNPVNPEPNLAKLTLSFDLWATETSPVLVRITSYTASNAASGSRYAIVTPPVKGAFYRFSVDLSEMTAGSPDFKPLDPQVRLDVEINSGGASGWPKKTNNQVRIDNVTYTSPAYYVGASGSDSNNGRTETTPFRTVQKAINVAIAGDVICIKNGTYTNNGGAYLAQFIRAGTPTGWIVLRPNPGEAPVLFSDGWNAVKMDASCAFIEVRDLHITGNRLNVTLSAAAADANAPSANKIYNGSGISVEGRKIGSVDTPPNQGAHHFRFVRNVIENHCGGGVGSAKTDYIIIEDNVVNHNSYYTRYATSGISVHRSWNFDSTTDFKSFVIGNVSHHNRCYVNWTGAGHNYISDGNGIIVDTNWGDVTDYYHARTLIQNNVSYNNGGASINVHKSTRVDVVNNTTYMSVQTPELAAGGWGEVMVGYSSQDVRFRNNIFWATGSQPITIRGGSGSTLATGLRYDYNLFGSQNNNGAIAPGDASHTNNIVWTNVSQIFVNPGASDFRLKAGSPALDNGTLTLEGVPRLDLIGLVRPRGTGIDRGAYEY